MGKKKNNAKRNKKKMQKKKEKNPHRTGKRKHGGNPDKYWKVMANFVTGGPCLSGRHRELGTEEDGNRPQGDDNHPASVANSWAIPPRDLQEAGTSGQSRVRPRVVRVPRPVVDYDPAVFRRRSSTPSRPLCCAQESHRLFGCTKDLDEEEEEEEKERDQDQDEDQEEDQDQEEEDSEEEDSEE